MSSEPESIKRLIEEDPFSDMEIPAALHQSIERHRANLARLVLTLHSAGVSEEQIETSVSVIVASYKEELLQAIKTMVAR